MTAELATGYPYSIHFSGNCTHCGNATLLHIRELDIDTCAYCNQQASNLSETAQAMPTSQPKQSKQAQGEVREMVADDALTNETMANEA